MSITGYKSLIVWHKSIELTKEIYTLSNKLPASEQFGLKSQIRRAAISVVSNIAEGSSRKSALERRRFYEIARSSAIEIDAQIETAFALNFLIITDADSSKLILTEVFRILTKMIT